MSQMWNGVDRNCEYKEIKVDKCSRCEGIWLDAGELEAISKIEKKGLDKLFTVFKR